MPFSWFYCTYLCFFFLTIISTNSSSSTPTTFVSYADHCSSFVLESTPTARASPPSMLNLFTSYVTSDDNLFGIQQKNHRIHSNYYKTISDGIYKVKGSLYISSPNLYYDNSSSIRFSMTGFWSKIPRKLCIVGSGSTQVDRIRTVDLDAVLKVTFASENSNIYTGVVNGTLESTNSVVNDPGYFDPIFIFHFPELSNYSYSLVSGQLGGRLVSDVAKKNRPLGLKPIKLCSIISSLLEMEHDGMGSRIGLSSSRFLAMDPIQCSGDGEKLRFVARFQNMSYAGQTFHFESTFIGEASWDDKNNELSGVACRLFNPADNSSNAIGDCTMGLSLIWNEPKAVGQFWSNKKVDDSGYFGKVNLTGYDFVRFPDLRYEYKDLDRAEKLCSSVIKPAEKGKKYPDGRSDDMNLDMRMSVTMVRGIVGNVLSGH